MPFLCASFCQGLCFRRSEARVAQPARAHHRVLGYGHMVLVVAYNVVRDIEYGQNSMSEIKTLAQKMEIGRYGKLGNWIPKFSSPPCGGPKSGVSPIRGIFATHIGSATLLGGFFAPCWALAPTRTRTSTLHSGTRARCAARRGLGRGRCREAQPAVGPGSGDRCVGPLGGAGNPGQHP